MNKTPEQTLNEQTLYDIFINQLELNSGNGLIEIKNVNKVPFNQKRMVEQAQKLGVDAVYFVNGNPVLYFKRLSIRSNETIRDLQHKIWNQGRVPFLIIITPGEIRVINAQSIPVFDSDNITDNRHQIYPISGNELSNELLDLNTVERAQALITQILFPFQRESIDSNNIWENQQIKEAIKNYDRIDRRLLRGLRSVRENLLQDKIPEDVINSLLIRSFLIMYLQDRKALPDNSVQSSNNNECDFLEILQNYDDTYAFFDALSDRFNGTVFRVTELERTQIQIKHLLILRKMLLGVDLQTGQEPLFRLYRFEHIPIEMISCLYEEFLRYQENERAGAFYTSPVLVKILLDEVTDWANINENVKILDPACGSGIFLVEAFNRLVDQWKYRNPDKRMNANSLCRIIQKNLFGVDIDQNAINVATLSLYIALLDNLEPEYIRKRMRKFPSLIGKNLLISDFFDEGIPLKRSSFDLIIGNVPWESKLTKSAEKFCSENNFPINDKQIALAFLWRAPCYCHENGEICLIVSSKAVLFNKRGLKFRKNFFNEFFVSQIIDFSMLRREKSVMFSQAIGPAAAIFYNKQSPEHNHIISYIVPTITPSLRWIGIPTVDPADIKHLPINWLSKNDKLWKMAFWGGPRDYLLIERLDGYPKLGDFLKISQRVPPQEGYKLAKPRREKKPEVYDSESIDSSSRVSYKLLLEDTVPLQISEFYSFKNPEIYKPPLVIIRQSPLDGKIQAFFSDIKVIYPERFVGFPCKDEFIPQMKLLTLFLNSSLAAYYYFLTSAEWGIERDNLQLKEHLNLPFIVPELRELDNPESTFSRLLIEFDKLTTINGNLLFGQEEARNETLINIDNLFFDLYQISASERDLVLDAIHYTIPFFIRPHSKESKKKPDSYQLKNYISIFIDTFIKTNNQKNFSLQGTVFTQNPNSSLIVVGFSANKHLPEEKIDTNCEQLFSEIDKKILNPLLPLGQSIYSRRNIRYFTGNSFFIIKSNEARLWTKSFARIDSDAIIGDLLLEYVDRSAVRGK